MNKAFTPFHVGNLFSLIALSTLLVACASPVPTTQIVNTPTQISESTATQTPTEAPIPPDTTQPSALVFPHITGDAGNFALLAGETITITWENAPAGADRYEFVLTPQNQEPSFVLGIDFDDADGVAVSWTIPEHIAAELRATAYFTDGRKIESDASMLYSGEFPPAGVCSLMARNQPVEVYRQPDRKAEIFALLSPAVYAQVLEIASDGWYRIDASVAELFTSPQGNLPGQDFGNPTISLAMHLDISPASGEGWVNSDKGILLVGTCSP